MAQINVPPTKSNLLRIKDDLKLAQEGHDLLDQKREVLINELMSAAYDLREAQENLYESLRKCFDLFKQACVVMGEERVAAALAFKPVEPELDFLNRSVMGVIVPQLIKAEPPMQPRSGPRTSCDLLDRAANAFVDIFPLLAKYIEKYTAVWRLATEVKKTQRRVNALENIFIPDYQDTIRAIEGALESNERDDFFRRKQVKKRIAREAAAGS